VKNKEGRAPAPQKTKIERNIFQKEKKRDDIQLKESMPEVI